MKKNLLNIFNRKYLILLVITVVSIVLIRAYFLDAWLKAGIIQAGQAAVGAKVDVRSAHLAVMTGHVQIKGVAVGDRLHPFRNLVEVKVVDLDLSTRSLLSGQVYVQNAQVSGIELGTSRKTSAALNKPKPPKKKVKLRKPTKLELEAQQEVKKTMAYYSWEAISTRLGLDELMDTSAFQFTNKLSKTSKDLSEWPANLEAQLASPNIEAQALLVQKQWDTLQKNAPSEFTKLPAYIKQVQALQDQIVSLNDLVQDKQKRINHATDYWQAQVSGLQKQANNDLLTLQDRIRSVQAKPMGAMNSVLGDQYKKVIVNVQDKVDMVLSKVKPKPKKIPWYQRFNVKGDDVVFPIYEHRPKFLIEHVQCDGVFGRFGDAFMGTIDEITFQQNVRNKPTVLKFHTKQGQSPRQFNVKGIIDLRGGVSMTVSGVASGFPVGASYWDTASIPFTIEKGLLGVNGQFVWSNGQLNLGTDIRAEGLQFIQAPSFREDDLFHKLMKDVVASTSLVDLKVRFEKGLLSMDSNLDEALSNAMNRVIDVEKSAWMKSAAAQWEQLVGEPLKGFEKQWSVAKGQVDESWRIERQKVDAQLVKMQDEMDKKMKSLGNQVDAERTAAEEKVKLDAKRAGDAVDLAKKIEEERLKKVLEEKVKGLKLF